MPFGFRAVFPPKEYFPAKTFEKSHPYFFWEMPDAILKSTGSTFTYDLIKSQGLIYVRIEVSI